MTMDFSGPVYFGGNPDTGSPWFSVDINSVAFSLFGREIKWYGIIIGLGLVLAMLYAFRRCKKFGIDADKMLDVILLGVIAGIIGARAYYVIFAWDEYAGRSFWDIINISQGGMAIYGGVIGGLGVGYLACKWRKVCPLPMLDLASMGFLIGQGVGRWGNFMNQEAFGGNTTLPWGMYSAGTNRYLTSLSAQGVNVDPTMPVHPCFLYESIWCLLGFLLLHIFSKKFKKYDGQIFLLYILWYGLGRCVIEGLRTDSLMFGPYRISQLLAGLCVVVAAILLFVFRKRTVIFGEEGLEAQLAAEAAAKEAKLAAKGKHLKTNGDVAGKMEAEGVGVEEVMEEADETIFDVADENKEEEDGAVKEETAGGEDDKYGENH